MTNSISNFDPVSPQVLIKGKSPIDTTGRGEDRYLLGKGNGYYEQKGGNVVFKTPDGRAVVSFPDQTVRNFAARVGYQVVDGTGNNLDLNA